MAVKVKQHKGAWWVFIDHKGKRKAKRIGASKKAAEQVAEKIQAKIALGQFEIKDEQKQRPFDTYFRNWMDTYVRAHCKERTVEAYTTVFRLYLAPAFGQTDIGEITRDAVKTLAYGLLAQGKSRSTVHSVLTPLSGMFSSALEDGHVDRTPVMRILRHARTEGDGQHQKASAFAREELGTLLRTCQEHFPAMSPFVSLLARTGIRFREGKLARWRPPPSEHQKRELSYDSARTEQS